ncbi:MAG TPA: tetratricopeptide repeat protein, partial [Bryobacteraceae bacterium]|nr:tetratricopeptide repeat protein [Bryobacteraceae bacterium]
AAAQAGQFAAKDRADAPHMSAVLNLQAAVAIDQRKFQDAQSLLQNADSILASRASETQPDRMDTLLYSGLLASASGDARRAIDALNKWINLRGPQASDDPEAVALRALARSELSQRDYPQSAAALSRVLAIRGEIGGASDRELSADYFDLGSAWKSSNKLPEAVTAFRRALDLRERPREARPESLPVYAALGETLVALGKPSDALPYLETRLRLMDPTGQARSDDVLRLADQVSRMQFSGGRYQDAEPLLRRLYDAALAGQGPAAQDRAELLAHLGETETKLKRNDQAVRFLDELSRIDLLRKKLPEASETAERAVEAAKQSQTPVSVSSALNALADIRVAQGKLDDAAALYEQARSAGGSGSRAQAISLNGLGRIALNKKQSDDADKLLNQALEAVRSDSSPSPGLEALVVANLAAAQLATGNLDRATELYARFLTLEPQSHPPEDPPLLEQLNELARFYSLRNGRPQDVLDVRNRVVRSSQLVFGDQSDEFAWALFNEAEFYRNQKQYNEAAPLYERSLRLFQALHGEHSDEVRNVTDLLAAVYRADGRPKDAIQLLEPLVQASGGDSGLFQADLLDRLAGLYRETGDQADAIRIYENLMNAYAPQAPAFQNSKWLEAAKNLIAANIEAKKAREAAAIYEKAVARVHSSAHKDTASEASLMRSYSAALRKDNRGKEADSIDNKAKRIEAALGGAR